METVFWRGFLLNSSSSNQEKESSVLIIQNFQLQFWSTILSNDFDISLTSLQILRRGTSSPLVLHKKFSLSFLPKTWNERINIFSIQQKTGPLSRILGKTPLNRDIHICFYHLRYIRYTDTISYRVYISIHARSKWRSCIPRESHVKQNFCLKNSN